MSSANSVLSRTGRINLTAAEGDLSIVISLSLSEAQLLADNILNHVDEGKRREADTLNNRGTLAERAAADRAAEAKTILSANELPEKPSTRNRYYVSTTRSGAVRLSRPFDTLEEAMNAKQELADVGTSYLGGHALVVRDTIYESVMADRPDESVTRYYVSTTAGPEIRLSGTYTTSESARSHHAFEAMFYHGRATVIRHNVTGKVVDS